MAIGVAAPPAWSQAGRSDATAYPGKPVRIVVGFAAGGGTDVMGRFFAQRFTEDFKQNFFVENKAGAGGNIGAEFVGKATGDGYTLLMTVSSHVINASLYKRIPYDPIKDFAPVSLVALAPNILTATPSAGVKTLRELVVLAKSRPGEISYSSPGSGTAQHLAAELFSAMAGVKLLHIPYNGGGPATTAALGGQVPLMTSSLPTALPHIRSGKLIALGVTSATRSELAPDLPTIAEAGDLPGYEATVWYGLLAAAGTPAPIVQKLNAEIERLIKLPELRERMIAMGFEPHRTSPEEFARIIATDLQKWAKVVQISGANAD
jgi:tripartite-type tricarboxylate transporter receptor subunit TctC